MKPRGSLSAVEWDKLRSEVTESLRDEGRGAAKRGRRLRGTNRESRSVAEVKGQDGEGKGQSPLI